MRKILLGSLLLLSLLCACTACVFCTKPTRMAITATVRSMVTRSFTKNNTPKDFYAVTKTLSTANLDKAEGRLASAGIQIVSEKATR
jgi:hypothetical protein